MNQDRRTRIHTTIKEFSGLTARVSDLIAQIEAVRSEEQDAYDNLSESLQASPRGIASEDACNLLDDALTNLNDIESSLNDCESNLEAAAGE